VIRGYLDVLGDEVGPQLEDDQIELLKRLTVSANRLSGYVNNILNAARYDRRHLSVHLREESIPDIYESINDDMQLRAASQNRLLSVKFPDDLPAIAADRSSISEVLSNLIDNALKYSNEGGLVQVGAHTTQDSVIISVQDYGIGMPGNVVSNLFHKFYRSHRSRETVAGTGIGLYICKAIVESHGGKIGVRSVEGEGSTFEFSLPIYSTVAEKLKADNNSNESLISRDGGSWIKNHSMFRG
jgi:two-component system phosphate regulon sensor histidine kinase PhoR/two-component system sensor histidine kinase VicK